MRPGKKRALRRGESNGGWRDDAACKGADVGIFFPEPIGNDVNDKTPTELFIPAQVICHECPVKADCLDYAMTNEHTKDSIQGVYGGLTPSQRRALRHGRPVKPFVPPEPPPEPSPDPPVVCRNGHPWDEENTYTRPDMQRQCRACKRERTAEKRAQFRAEGLSK